MPGGPIIVIVGGGGTVPRTPDTYPVAASVGDWISNESHDLAIAVFQTSPTGPEMEIAIYGKDTYTFGSAGNVLSVT